MTPRFDIAARTANELHWSAHLHCGIFDLVAEGLATVRFVPELALRPREVLATVLEVTDRWSGRRRVLAFDWRDNPDVVAPRKLAESDLYFKRNYIPSVTEAACPADQRGKLRPAGLSFTVRGDRERPLWVLLIGGLARHEEPVIGHSLSWTLHNLYKGLVRNPRTAQRFVRKEELEGGTLEGSRNVVFYQLRAYDPRHSSFPDETTAVMAQRVEIIRTLRRELGPQFVGGLVPRPHVLEQFPDCVTPFGTTRRAYLRIMKASRIGVYTRGLRQSPAFKLAEYLASARCILAERPRFELPRPLEDGEEVLFFDSVPELVDKARMLLADPPLQQRLSAGARAYYEAEVKPSARVRKFLELAFDDTLEAAPTPVAPPVPFDNGA